MHQDKMKKLKHTHWINSMRYNNNTNKEVDKGDSRHRPGCPYCGSTNTELFSLFGQQLLTVQYYCNTCHTPFEHIKDDDVLDDYATRKEGQL
jgi:DNA-directed RNA polymerase subunit RPC12/RpoP